MLQLALRVHRLNRLRQNAVLRLQNLDLVYSHAKKSQVARQVFASEEQISKLLCPRLVHSVQVVARKTLKCSHRQHHAPLLLRPVLQSPTVPARVREHFERNKSARDYAQPRCLLNEELGLLPPYFVLEQRL